MNGLIVHEVGMRDGLQMEQQIVPLPEKVKWINQLIDAGVDIVQLGSFVHPTKVPQMADTDELFHCFGKEKQRPVIFSALVLNEKGLERGLRCGVEMFCMGVSASETHSRKNTGMPIREATERIIAMAVLAGEEKKRIQVSVQSAFGCGYEGRVPQEHVMKIVERFLGAGLRAVSLADTAGHATPDRVEQIFSAIRELDDDVELACHFHNTYGLAMANCYAALKAGVTYFESSIAGLGGCPFTKIAGGNVATEDLVHFLQRMGQRTDIGLDRLIDTANDVTKFFGHEMNGVIHKTGAIQQQHEIA